MVRGVLLGAFSQYLHGDVDLSDNSDNHGRVYGDQQQTERFLALSFFIGHIGLGHERKKVAGKHHDASLRQYSATRTKEDTSINITGAVKVEEEGRWAAQEEAHRPNHGNSNKPLADSSGNQFWKKMKKNRTLQKGFTTNREMNHRSSNKISKRTTGCKGLDQTKNRASSTKNENVPCLSVYRKLSIPPNLTMRYIHPSVREEYGRVSSNASRLINANMHAPAAWPAEFGSTKTFVRCCSIQTRRLGARKREEKICNIWFLKITHSNHIHILVPTEKVATRSGGFQRQPRTTQTIELVRGQKPFDTYTGASEKPTNRERKRHVQRRPCKRV